MEIRLATIGDVPDIASLYEKARILLRERGIDQWQEGYPNADSARNDIENAYSFVIVENGEVIGTAALDVGVEPTYVEIFEGEWKTESPIYAFVHRVAVNPEKSGKGLAAMFFGKAEGIAREHGVISMRCDTHRDNHAMQKTLKNAGFEYCGIIYLETGAERLAFEKVLR